MTKNNHSPFSQKDDHIPQDVLHAYLDDELNSATGDEVARHLVHCSQCAARRDRIQATFSDLQGLPPIPLDTDLTPRILHKLQARDAHFPALSWIAVLQTVIAAALLLLSLPALPSLPGFQVTWERWMKGLTLFHISLLDTVGVVEANIHQIQQTWERSSTYFSNFPTPDIHFLPVWTFFLIAALLGILGNTLLFNKDINR